MMEVTCTEAPTPRYEVVAGGAFGVTFIHGWHASVHTHIRMGDVHMYASMHVQTLELTQVAWADMECIRINVGLKYDFEISRINKPVSPSSTY